MTARYADGRGNPPGSPWRDGGPEASRHTVRLPLRVRPEVAAALTALAAHLGGTLSAAATEAILERCRALGIAVSGEDALPR